MSDDQRCESCQHWATIDIDDEPVLHDENGGRVIDDDDYSTQPAPGRWGWCNRAAEFGPQRASRFYVVDGSHYFAKLGTRSDFGCVEHEPASPVVVECPT